MPRHLSVRKKKLMVIGLSLLVCSSGAQALAQKFEGQCSPHQPPGGRIPGAPADLKAC